MTAVFLVSSCKCSTIVHSMCVQDGWTTVLAAARYGHVELLRELVIKHRCDKNAVKEVHCN